MCIAMRTDTFFIEHVMRYVNIPYTNNISVTFWHIYQGIPNTETNACIPIYYDANNIYCLFLSEYVWEGIFIAIDSNTFGVTEYNWFTVMH